MGLIQNRSFGIDTYQVKEERNTVKSKENTKKEYLQPKYLISRLLELHRKIKRAT